MDIGLGVISEDGSLVKEGGTNIGGGINELLSEFIQRWKTSSQVVETTSNGALSTTFFVQEIDERLLAPATVVGYRVLLVFLPEEFDSWEGFDAVHHSDGFVVTRVRIHVGKNAVLLVLEIARDFLEDGFQSFAVSTPRGGESDENVLGFVQCSRVEIVDGESHDFGWGRWFDIRFGTGLFGDTVRRLIQVMVDEGGDRLFDHIFEFATAFVVSREVAICVKPLEG